MIESYDFGTYIIDGKEYKWDIKIINDKVHSWTDRKGHIFRIENVKDLTELYPDTLVIGTGYSGLMQVPDEVKTFVKEKGINLVVENTREACRVYNELEKQGKKVCAIFHGTC